MSSAFVPGSFDPITLGHIDIIERASKIFDKVYVVIAINADKKYLFSLEERKEIAEAAVKNLGNVEVIICDGIVVELAKALGVNVLVKGIRNEKDLEYENNIEEINKGIDGDIETVYLPAKKELSNISSTAARKFITYGMPIERFVGKTVADKIAELAKRV